jgi:septal ring factor EnvC (AmiA/AmiB activator)
MTDYLGGERAFEIVLRQLVESECENHALREKRNNDDYDIHKVSREIASVTDERNKLYNRILELKQQIEGITYQRDALAKDIEVAGKLFQAAEQQREAIYKLIEASDLSENPHEKLSEAQRERVVEMHRALQKAVTASESLNPIPF